MEESKNSENLENRCVIYFNFFTGQKKQKLDKIIMNTLKICTYIMNKFPSADQSEKASPMPWNKHNSQLIYHQIQNSAESE